MIIQTRYQIKPLITILMLCCYISLSSSNDLKESVQTFLDNYNEKMSELSKKNTLAWWNYETDMTKEHRQATLEISTETSKYMAEARKNASEFDLSSDELPDAWKRQLILLKRTAAPKSAEDAKEVSKLVSKMTSIYSETRPKERLKSSGIIYPHLNKDLLPIMSKPKKENLKLLKKLWKDWRNKVGPQIKPMFQRYVELVNKGAKENGLNDYGEFWRDAYEIGAEKLKTTISDLWQKLKPLYNSFHAYIRFKLNEKFGDENVTKAGPLPAHLLGMWGEHWDHLYNYVAPYSDKKIPDVTPKMKEKNFTPEKVLKLAENFFVSIDLEPMPESFWKKSLIKKEEGKKTVCHPSSWDFGGGDVRLKMPCMGTTQSDLVTVHHEMGHLEYYLLYKDKPQEFRTGANPGFHEAVGDTIALSVMVPRHLQKIDLLDNLDEDKETDINYLMKEALHKISFLPFGYIVDIWRWSVFAGETTEDQYTQYWWELRKKLQGVVPPEERPPEAFDPGCFFHIVHNTEYLRYFVSYILQYQFHKALCKEANQEGELYKCSIHNSKEAGGRLRNAVKEKFGYSLRLDLTKKNLDLLKRARELIEDRPEVDFVFTDINCRLVLKMANDSMK